MVELNQKHLNQYRSFMIRGLNEHPDFFRISVEDEKNAFFPTLTKPDSFTLSAMNQETIMGVVSFAREGENRMKIRHKGSLFRMYVAQEFSGRGIGKMLIQEVIQRAKLLPVMEQINLSLVSDNLRAKQLYSYFGFETYGIEKMAHKSGDQYFDEEFMSLNLRKIIL